MHYLAEQARKTLSGLILPLLLRPSSVHAGRMVCDAVLFNILLTDPSSGFPLHISEKYLAVHFVLYAQHSLSTFTALTFCSSKRDIDCTEQW